VDKEIIMVEANLAVTEAAMIPAPELLEVRVFTADGDSGYGAREDSLTLDELTVEAANSLLQEAGLELSEEERIRMVVFAQTAGSRAIVAASSHMGQRGWMRFTYLGNDTGAESKRIVNPARTYGINKMASWYTERTIARPSDRDCTE
jgi:hypothetical protein